jgi:sialidase-1
MKRPVLAVGESGLPACGWRRTGGVTLRVTGITAAVLLIRGNFVAAGPSYSDAWDVSQGSTVVAYSEIDTPWFDARDMFGGTFGTYLPEQGSTIFTDAYPKGHIHWVEWRTPSPIVLRGFDLYANSDGSANGYYRGMDHFTLKVIDFGTSQYRTVYDANVAPYDWAEIHGTLAAPATGQQFRAEFTQYQDWGGPRIRELDAVAASNTSVQRSSVFTSGESMPCFRIPSLIVAPNGDLVAFAEGRRSWSDPGSDPSYAADLVCKRSTDGGTTWSGLTVLAHNDQYDYSDPRAFVDASTGKVSVAYSQWPTGLPDNSATYIRSSSTNGQTWDAAVNITSQVRDPTWTSLDTNSGAGIQLRWQTNAARNGRIVLPGYFVTGETCRDVAFYSDNHGATWSHGAVAISTGFSDQNESQIVELTNGDLLLDSRQMAGNYRYRWISHDGGATWGSPRAGDIAIGPVNTGLLRYSAKRDGDDRDRILFSGPLGTPVGAASDLGRTNLGIWTSYDEGKTFINPVQIDSSECGYSTMQELADGSVGVIYENNWTIGSAASIGFAKFTLATLESQPRSSHLTHYDGFGNNIDRSRGGMGWSGAWQGTGVATNAYGARLGGTGLSYSPSPVPTESGRMDLIPGHSAAKRLLATPIDLNTNSSAYVALLMSQALDPGPVLSDKPLDIQLRDANEVSQLGFGVNSAEQFYISNLGNSTQSTMAPLKGSSTYLMLLKIVSQDASQAGNVDQIFLTTFQSGVDAIPDTDVGLNWTLIGLTDANSSAILDRIVLMGSSTAIWSFDEVRIGDTFGAVARGVADIPEPATRVLSLMAAAALLFRRLCRRW